MKSQDLYAPLDFTKAEVKALIELYLSFNEKYPQYTLGKIALNYDLINHFERKFRQLDPDVEEKNEFKLISTLDHYLPNFFEKYN